MAAHPKVLDAVSALLGPNLLIWGSRWFTKMPGDKTYVSWHQDGTYQGKHPPDVTTAWIALSDSVSDNGCMRVVPRRTSQAFCRRTKPTRPTTPCPRDRKSPSKWTNHRPSTSFCSLTEGEMSLHHIGIVHGSNVNRSGTPRIGLAVRYMGDAVVQEGKERSLAMLVRGRDEFGNFQYHRSPFRRFSDKRAPLSQEAVRRMLANVMPKK